MGTTSCCVARTDAVVEGEPYVPSSPMSPTFSQQWHEDRRRRPASLSREWSIVASSISPDELEKLSALRDVVKDMDEHPACQERPLHKQGQTLLRFLRGRAGDVREAEVMFRKSMDWRHDFGVDAKVERWRQELAEGVSARAKLVITYGTDMNLARDKFGVPVWLMRLGVVDAPGMLREIGKEALLVNSLYRMEEMHVDLRKAMFREGRVVRGCVQVLDVGSYDDSGFMTWCASMWKKYYVVKDAFKVWDANYPETTRKIFLVRMNKVTKAILDAAKPFVPPRTRKKQKVCGESAEEWVAELRHEMPDGAALPRFLVCDSADAFREAEPKGGLVPAGGVVSDDMVRLASESRERWATTGCHAPVCCAAAAAARDSAGADVGEVDDCGAVVASPPPPWRSSQQRRCGGVSSLLVAAVLGVALGMAAATLDVWPGLAITPA